MTQIDLLALVGFLCFVVGFGFGMMFKASMED